MELEITYPIRTETKEVRIVMLMMGQNKALVELWGDGRDRVEVDLTQIIEDRKADMPVIEEFLSTIISLAGGIDKAEIPTEEIFKTELVEITKTVEL